MILDPQAVVGDSGEGLDQQRFDHNINRHHLRNKIFLLHHLTFARSDQDFDAYRWA